MSESYEIGPTSRLLLEVFAGADVGASRYLQWLYCDNPDGVVVAADLDDERGRLGHYAVVPWPCVEDGGALRSTLSLNTAVAERGRGGGLFTSLANSAFATAMERGYDTVVGVANANSTPGFVRRLAFTLINPLPVEVLVPIPLGRARIVDGLPDPRRLADTLAAAALGSGLMRAWSPESLQWRLTRPDSTYEVHDGGDWIAVSTVDRSQHIPIAILLAVISARPLTVAEARAVVRRLCRVHASPLVLHAGFNDHWPLRGVPLPARLRPSPLNLIFRRLDSDAPAPSVGRFEFLDFDAY